MGLTKHPEGSLKELATIAVPLMLTSLSTMTMILADRWFLAHYSITAHNAAVVATTLGWAFIFGWIVLANISEVFVAQFNGAGLHKQMGKPVWQMIWLAALSVFFFLPVSYWGTTAIYGNGFETAYERDYFSIMMMYGPFYPLFGALSGFFIGQGKTRLITYVVIVANIVNIALDQLLIFGVEGWIPSLGIKGAAISTSVATIIQSAILLVAFFSKKHREAHGTLNWKFNFSQFSDCIKIGLPNAIFLVFEILGFAVFYALMKDMGIHYITVVGICQSMWIMFAFFAEGIHKATITVVGNFIGAGKIHLIPQVMKAGLKMNGLYFALMTICVAFGVQFVIHQFLPNADADFVKNIRGPLEACLYFMAIYMFFEGLRYQFGAVLTAAGDTIFLFIAGTTMVWMFIVLPVYLYVVPTGASVETAFSMWVFYSVVSSIVYLGRIWQGKWRSMTISQDLPLKT